MAAKRKSVDHAQLVDDLHAQLDTQLAALATSDEWLAYLAAARRFHRYSPNNQLLLALQGAEGHVASYNTWKKIPSTAGGTCQVAKGQKGLTILAPMTSKSTDVDEATGEETTRQRLRGFRAVKVFHQGQLIAPPAVGDEVMPELLQGDDRWEHVWSAVSGQLESDGFEVTRHSRSPVEKWNGMTSYADRRVLVADTLEPPQALKTLLHEWGHVELDHEHRADLGRPIKEVEAESVAYLLAQSVGLDSAAYSLPYITAWAGGDIANVRKTAEQVLTTAKRLVQTLEDDLGVVLAPDLVADVVERQASVVPIEASTPVLSPAAAVQETLPLGGLPPRSADSATNVVDIEDRRFLKAMLDDLERAQRERVASFVYDPARAGDVAVVLAESGKTASQVARLLDRLHIAPPEIAAALLVDVEDLERPTLFSVGEARDALTQLDDRLDVDDLIPLVERPAPSRPDRISPENIDDLRVIERALRRHDNPASIAALADGLRLEAQSVIKVCRAVGTRPAQAIGVAIEMHGGDPRAALDCLATSWPDVDGGWDQHTHPSLRSRPELSLVAEPERAILDQWTGRSRPTLASVSTQHLPT